MMRMATMKFEVITVVVMIVISIILSFVTEIEGEKWWFSIGGDSYDIYRVHIKPETKLKEIKDLVFSAIKYEKVD